MSNIFDFTSLHDILNFEPYLCESSSNEDSDKEYESLPRYFQVCLVCLKKFDNCECNEKIKSK